GVLYFLNKCLVSLFTETSVVCADNNTAMVNSNGFSCTSSHSASGNIFEITSIISNAFLLLIILILLIKPIKFRYFFNFLFHFSLHPTIGLKSQFRMVIKAYRMLAQFFEKAC